MLSKLEKFELSIWYYPLMMTVYALSLASRAVFRPGVASCVLTALIIVHSLLAGRLFIVKKGRTMDIIMSIWLFYNIISGIWTVKNGIPFSIYAGELITTALPMFFYFVGRTFGNENRERFYRLFIASVSAVGLLGLVLYIAAPQWYCDYLFELGYISLADVPTMRVRMVSVIGSTLMGYLSVAAMLACSHFMLDSRDTKRGKLYTLLFFFNFFLAFMSNQRAAMVVAILTIVYMNYLIFFTFEMLPTKVFMIEMGIFAAGLVGLIVVFHGAFMKVYYRLVSLPGAVGQRSDQWVGAANNMVDKWLGNGLGANGHRAAGFTEHLIADGGIAKLYCEMGIIGTSLFIFLMLLAFKKGLKNLRSCAPEIGIVMMTLLVSVGSNMMSFALAVPVLYFAVGAIAGSEE